MMKTKTKLKRKNNWKTKTKTKITLLKKGVLISFLKRVHVLEHVLKSMSIGANTQFQSASTSAHRSSCSISAKRGWQLGRRPVGRCRLAHRAVVPRCPWATRTAKSSPACAWGHARWTPHPVTVLHVSRLSHLLAHWWSDSTRRTLKRQKTDKRVNVLHRGGRTYWV